MPEYTTKNTPFFLHEADELAFMEALQARLPKCVLIDGCFWETTSPPVKTAFADCTSRTVYLWNPDSQSKLPYIPRSNGKFQGPTSGVVVQVCRSRIQDGTLLSGDIGIGYDKNDESMVFFVKEVWNGLRILKSGPLASVDPKTRAILKSNVSNYIVGPAAREYAERGGILKHVTANVYYLPV